MIAVFQMSSVMVSIPVSHRITPQPPFGSLSSRSTQKGHHEKSNGTTASIDLLQQLNMYGTAFIYEEKVECMYENDTMYDNARL